MDESTEKQTKVERWAIEHRTNQSTVSNRLVLKCYDGFMSIAGYLNGELVSAGLINAKVRRCMIDTAVKVLEYQVRDPDTPTIERLMIEEVPLQIGMSFKFIKIQDGFVRFILKNHEQSFLNVCVETSQSELGELMSALHHRQWFPLNGQRIPDS